MGFILGGIMARARKASDDVWNAKRKAQRLLNRLQKKTQSNLSTEAEIKEYQEKVSEIQGQIKNVKYNRKTKQYPTSISSFKQAINAKVKNTFVDYIGQRNTTKRNDQITKMQEAKFRSKDNMMQWSAHVFYRYTQELWEGQDAGNRNNAIVDTMKNNNAMLYNGNLVENLSDAFKYVQERMSSEFKERERYYSLLEQNTDDWSEADEKFMNEMFNREQEDVKYETFAPASISSF